MTWLSAIGFVCVAFCLACLFGSPVKRALHRLMLKFLGLPPFDKAVLVLAMAVATACAQKVGTNDLDIVEGGTNGVENGETEACGAGEWHRIRPDNFFFEDMPSFAEYCPPPWSAGSIDWVIPLAWGESNAEGVSGRSGVVETTYHQVFTFSPDGGIRIDKFSQWIHCGANGAVTHSEGIR